MINNYFVELEGPMEKQQGWIYLTVISRTSLEDHSQEINITIISFSNRFNFNYSRQEPNDCAPVKLHLKEASDVILKISSYYLVEWMFQAIENYYGIF